MVIPQKFYLLLQKFFLNEFRRAITRTENRRIGTIVFHWVKYSFAILCFRKFINIFPIFKCQNHVATMAQTYLNTSDPEKDMQKN